MSSENRYRRPDAKLWAKIKPLARQMRQEPTTAEVRLWEQLRGRQINNLKFRRQHPIEQFVVDFFCDEARLIIEVDGEIHLYTQEEDALRQEFLEDMGFTVLRFTNERVMNSLDEVLKMIRNSMSSDS